MNYKTKRRILNVAAILVVLAVLIFRSFFTQTFIGVALLVALLLFYLLLSFKWWRCPHCDTYLGKLSPFATHCPFCGNELE